MALAALANNHIPSGEPIDLLNVAFENPRKLSLESNSDPYDVPDRRTSRKGLCELKALFPGRKWRMIEVNVTYEQTLASTSRVVELCAPSSSTMDFSIALAFYHASRGNGVLAGTQEEYSPTARVLFSGLGADEMFGGYTRHRAAFEKSGWSGLVSELQLDVSRIGVRNLGRDDRVVGDASKEVRFPFLDEGVVEFVNGLSVWEKCDFRLGRGVGDKRLLREVARRCFGMEGAGREVKRAIQFGARSAKMGSGRERGHLPFESVKGGDLEV
jgi:asparagine synthetase B (glutamine-hydrolysing)